MATLCLLNFPKFSESKEILKNGQSDLCVWGGVLLVRLLNRPTLYIQCAIILPFFIFSNTPRLGHYMCASLVNGEFYLNNDEDKPKKIDIKYVEEKLFMLFSRNY